MNFFKIILTLATVTMSSHAFGAWSLSSHYEKNPDSGINHSVVEFKTDSNTRKEYRPQQSPWGMVDNQRFVIGESTYFATAWAKGASSVLYRVFDMSKNRTEPVCEVISFAEKTKMRLSNSYIQIQILKDKNDERAVWKNCIKVIN